MGSDMDYYHFQILPIGYPRQVAFIVRFMCNGKTVRTENHPVLNTKFPLRTYTTAEHQAKAWCQTMNGLPAEGARARSGISREAVK